MVHKQIAGGRRKIGNSLIQRGGWIKFRLDELVREWFLKPEENFGLSIHSYDREGNPNPLTIIHHDDVGFDSSMVSCA